MRPSEIGSSDLVDAIREALLEEQWGHAVELWMEATGEIVDAYPDEPIMTASGLDEDRASMEIRLAPIFDESGDDA